MILREYQERFVANVRARYQAGDRSVLGVMPTGAGKTPCVAKIGQLVAARGRRTLFVAHTTELVAQAVGKFQAFGIKADVEQADKHASDSSVVVASIATLRGERLQSWPRDAFALVIHDEAHRTAAATSTAIVEHFSTAHLLGVTATPARGDGKGLADAYQSLVVGATIRDLTEQGYLVPSRVFVPAGDLRSGQLAMTPQEAYAKHGTGRPAVVFCQDVEHAEQVARLMPVATGVIHGELPARERKQVLEQFAAGELKALTTCSVLVEGWDEPSTAVCILARKFGHVGTFLQAIGRVLRPAPNKDHATVIDLCGSALVHGTPDTDREYSLDGKPIRKSDRLAIRQCPTCGYVFMGVREFCLSCGVQLPVMHRQAPSSADVGLVGIAPKSPPRPMPVIAMYSKFPGTCALCSGRISTGERIFWAKNQKPRHADCAARVSLAEANRLVKAS